MFWVKNLEERYFQVWILCCVDSRREAKEFLPFFFFFISFFFFFFKAALKTLSTVHKDFLAQIKPRVEQWSDNSQMGDLILSLVPFFKLYPVYVSEFEQQMKTLRETKSSNTAFAGFLSNAFKQLGDPSNDLASLLVTPVQRIPRYLMLVRSMLKHTWAEHPDYANLKTAEEQISAVAVTVDQKAKDAENVQKMHHVDTILEDCDFPLLDPQRRYVHMGTVFKEKLGTKNVLKAIIKPQKAKELCMFLFSDMVIWGIANPDKKTYKYYDKDPLFGMAVEEEKDKPFQFKLVLANADLAYLICVRTEDDKRVWLEHLSQNIRDSNLKATTLRNVRDQQDKKKLAQAQAAQPAPTGAAITAGGKTGVVIKETSGWRHVAGDSVPLQQTASPTLTTSVATKLGQQSPPVASKANTVRDKRSSDRTGDTSSTNNNPPAGTGEEFKTLGRSSASNVARPTAWVKPEQVKVTEKTSPRPPLVSPRANSTTSPVPPPRGSAAPPPRPQRPKSSESGMGMSRSASKDTSLDEHHPIEWRYPVAQGPVKVRIEGSAEGYNGREFVCQSEADGKRHVLLESLPDGVYFVQFLVDGNWIADTNHPSEMRDQALWNVFQVGVVSAATPPPLPPPPVVDLQEVMLIASEAFTPVDENGVMMEKGEIVALLNKNSDEWWYVRNSHGKCGLVSSSCFVQKVAEVVVVPPEMPELPPPVPDLPQQDVVVVTPPVPDLPPPQEDHDTNSVVAEIVSHASAVSTTSTVTTSEHIETPPLHVHPNPVPLNEVVLTGSAEALAMSRGRAPSLPTMYPGTDASSTPPIASPPPPPPTIHVHSMPALSNTQPTTNVPYYPPPPQTSFTGIPPSGSGLDPYTQHQGQVVAGQFSQGQFSPGQVGHPPAQFPYGQPPAQFSQGQLPPAPPSYDNVISHQQYYMPPPHQHSASTSPRQQQVPPQQYYYPQQPQQQQQQQFYYPPPAYDQFGSYQHPPPPSHPPLYNSSDQLTQQPPSSPNLNK